MAHLNTTLKRVLMYIFGLFFMAAGISLSIEANLGVSPVSSLAYAFALTTGFSVGIMTIIANIMYIIFQIVLSKQFSLRQSIIQLIITFLFGFLIDITLFFIRLIPTPDLIIMRWTYLIVSLFIIAIGLLFYFNAKLPLMPYDELTHVISEQFKFEFGKAKTISDLLNVGLAGVICLVFIHSLGSIGIGTIIAAYFIGKILGELMKFYRRTFPIKHAQFNKVKTD